MTSDRPIRLADVQSAKQASHRIRARCVQSAPTTDALRAALIEVEEELGVRQVRGLAHLDVLLELARRARQRRLAHFPGQVHTSAAEHLRQTGHELAFGCCRSQVDPTGFSALDASL